MIYLLDTSVCIDYLRRADSPMHTWMRAQPRHDIRLCSVVRAELLLGVHKRPSERNRRAVDLLLRTLESHPFDDDAAAVYAKLRADLERAGRVIGPNDMMIAAVAIARNATLVTGNSDEFLRVPGLSCLSLTELNG